MRRDSRGCEASDQFVLDAKEVLENIMRNNRLKQNDIAQIVSVAPSTVSRWVNKNNKTLIDMESAALLAIHLKQPIQTLFPPSSWVQNKEWALWFLSAQEREWLLNIATSARSLYEK